MRICARFSSLLRVEFHVYFKAITVKEYLLCIILFPPLCNPSVLLSKRVYLKKNGFRTIVFSRRVNYNDCDWLRTLGKPGSVIQSEDAFIHIEPSLEEDRRAYSFPT